MRLRHASSLPAERARRFSVRHFAATVAAIIASFGSAGTVAFAYGADALLPDHPLYTIRVAAEDIERQFAPAQKKGLVSMRHARRRLREMRRATDARPELLDQQAHALGREMAFAADHMQGEPEWLEALLIESRDLQEWTEQAIDKEDKKTFGGGADGLKAQMDILEEGMDMDFVLEVETR